MSLYVEVTPVVSKVLANLANGDIKVGCEKISYDLVKTIYNRATEVKNEN